jgi:phenylpropionate dioxygenase-like ring-hydroxylating dioxygenase large terminal subunit
MTYPWSWYADPDVLHAEQERIFARTWQYVGHAGQVGQAGDYFTAQLGRIPVVVTHADDGELRAFANVCRHRGSLVADGSGNRRTLQCPYHAWTYGLDGRLRTAPRADFDPGEVSLAPLRLDRWGPFLFANADGAGPELADVLGVVPSQVAEAGIDVDELRFHHRVDWTIAANWKLVSENFLECYHCAVAHPGFTAMVDVSPESYRLEAEGLVSSQFGALRENGSAPYDADGEVPRGQFHFLFPNTGLNIFPGRANVSIGPIVPTGPERTSRFLDYFFARDAEEAWIAELLAFDDQIGREDTALVERAQAGAAAGVVESGRLLGESERLVAHFQQLLRNALS